MNCAISLDQAVHRPAGFLLGEKLNGTVQDLCTDLLTTRRIAKVAWADGTNTNEPVEDLAGGAYPTKAPALRERLKALFGR